MKNRLQEIRWSCNMSQGQLVLKSGVSKSVISKLENDIHANTTVYSALLLARALNVSVEDIFTL